MRLAFIAEARRCLSEAGSEPQLDQTTRLLLVVDRALAAITQKDRRVACIAEMRIFGQMPESEIATYLGLPLRTVKREYAVARAVLNQHLQGGEPGEVG